MTALTDIHSTLLSEEVAKRLLQRLDWLRLEPQRIVELGCGVGASIKKLKQRYRHAHVVAIDVAASMLKCAQKRYRWRLRQHFCCADAYTLPLPAQSIDLIFSNLMLPWCADLNLLFAEMQRILKPSGALLFSSLGPDTLLELKQIFLKNNLSIEFTTLYDMHDVGDALIRNQLTEPVMDMEKISITYTETNKLFYDLNILGIQSIMAQPAPSLTDSNFLQQLATSYEYYRDIHGLLPATFEVVYGLAWKSTRPVGGKLTTHGEVAIPIATLKRSSH